MTGAVEFQDWTVSHSRASSTRLRLDFSSNTFQEKSFKYCPKIFLRVGNTQASLARMNSIKFPSQQPTEKKIELSPFFSMSRGRKQERKKKTETTARPLPVAPSGSFYSWPAHDH